MQRYVIYLNKENESGYIKEIPGVIRNYDIGLLREAKIYNDVSEATADYLKAKDLNYGVRLLRVRESRKGKRQVLYLVQ